MQGHMYGTKKMRRRPRRKENRENFYANKFASSTIYPFPSSTGLQRLFRDEGEAWKLRVVEENVINARFKAVEAIRMLSSASLRKCLKTTDIVTDIMPHNVTKKT